MRATVTAITAFIALTTAFEFVQPSGADLPVNLDNYTVRWTTDGCGFYCRFIKIPSSPSQNTDGLIAAIKTLMRCFIFI